MTSRAELSGFKTAVRQNVPVQIGHQRPRRLHARSRRRRGDRGGAGGSRHAHPAHGRRVARRRVDREPGAGPAGEEPQLHGAGAAGAGRDRGARRQPEHARAHAAAQPVGARPASLRQQHPARRRQHHRGLCQWQHVHPVAGIAEGSQRADRPVRRGLRDVLRRAGRHDRQVGAEHAARQRIHLSARRRAERATLLRLRASRRRSTSTSSAPRSARRSFANRTFFFVGYEGTRSDRETTGTHDRRHRRDAARRLLGAVDDRSAIRSRSSRSPATSFRPTGSRRRRRRCCSTFPLPTRTGSPNNYVATSPTDETENQYFGRIDHQLSQSTSLFGRVAVRKATIDTIQLNPNFKSFGQPENQNYVIGLTRAMSPRWLRRRARLVRPRVDAEPDRPRRHGHRSAARLRHQRSESRRSAAARHPVGRHHRLHGHGRDLRESAAALREPRGAAAQRGRT